MNVEEKVHAKLIPAPYKAMTKQALAVSTDVTLTLEAGATYLFQCSVDVYIQDHKTSALAGALTLGSTALAFRGDWCNHVITLGPSGTGGFLRIGTIGTVAGNFRYRKIKNGPVT